MVDLHFLLFFPGHGIVAATSSIPSKYQTIVTDNSDRKGFSSQAKRFHSESHFVSLLLSVFSVETIPEFPLGQEI